MFLSQGDIDVALKPIGLSSRCLWKKYPVAASEFMAH